MFGLWPATCNLLDADGDRVSSIVWSRDGVRMVCLGPGDGPRGPAGTAVWAHLRILTLLLLPLARPYRRLIAVVHHTTTSISIRLHTMPHARPGRPGRGRRAARAQSEDVFHVKHLAPNPGTPAPRTSTSPTLKSLSPPPASLSLRQSPHSRCMARAGLVAASTRGLRSEADLCSILSDILPTCVFSCKESRAGHGEAGGDSSGVVSRARTTL